MNIHAPYEFATYKGPVSTFVEQSVQNAPDYGDSEHEALRREVDKLTQIVANLVDTLSEKSIITAPEVTQVVDNPSPTATYEVVPRVP